MGDSSVYLTCLSIAFLSTVSALVTWRDSTSKVRGTGLWFLGYLCYFLSILGVASRDFLPDTPRQIITNSLECVGSYLQFAGFLMLYRCWDFWGGRVIGIGAALTAAALNCLGIVAQLRGRPELYTLVETVNNFSPGHLVLFLTIRNHKENRSYSVYVIAAYSFVTLVFLARMVLGVGEAVGLLGPIAVQAMDFYGPVFWIVLFSVLAFSQNQLASGILKDRIGVQVAELSSYKGSLERMNVQLIQSNKDIVAIFADALDTRISETSGHVLRVSEYTRILLDELGYDGEGREIVSNAAALHDIGKIGIPDEILRNEGNYSAAERAGMERHTILGHEMLRRSGTPLLRMAAIISLEHHERWDGLGYPYGKKGAQISFASRVVAVADVFDALIHDRSYKAAWQAADAERFIVQSKGSRFDPVVVGALPGCVARFVEVVEMHRGPGAASA